MMLFLLLLNTHELYVLLSAHDDASTGRKERSMCFRDASVLEQTVRLWFSVERSQRKSLLVYFYSTSMFTITKRNKSHLHDNVQLIGLGRTVFNPS